MPDTALQELLPLTELELLQVKLIATENTLNRIEADGSAYVSGWGPTCRLLRDTAFSLRFQIEALGGHPLDPIGPTAHELRTRKFKIDQARVEACRDKIEGSCEGHPMPQPEDK